MDRNRNDKSGGFTFLRLGDDIDNRGGLLIKNVEHYHAGDDPLPKPTVIEVPVDEPVSHHSQPQIEELSADDRMMAKLNAVVITPIDRIHAGIRHVKESGVINNDYEYAAIKYRIDSFRLFEKLSNQAFVNILLDSGAFTEDDCPTVGNIKKVQIDGDYPNWRIIGKGSGCLSQLFNVVKKFDEGCKTIG